ncbi:hypothetical protein AOE01nite_05470 [Acetobacter oeni]|uniref:Alpha 1,4-glycosyltransferase domain-containing protein n=1 Tax=Acetobacter oeni TaxID=304077 RepID=A0A511XHA0_9PROT|nr:hypothetical protein AA21952_1001 [Acetobacter oeni LMG 21952]GEN62323.1 hypothetical protein AOE01nite_05470 [Acetobacter oeni]
MSASPLQNRHFGTFWHGGRLSAIECACAYSFIRQGVSLTLFSYDPIENAPDGVLIEDARTITPQHMTSRFILNNNPHYGHFSDFFRYRMMLENNMTWIDLDMMVTGKIPDQSSGDIIAKEHGKGYNGAILYISSKNILHYLISETTRLMDKNLRWGETGPLLLGKMVRKFRNQVTVSDVSKFYPIAHGDIYKILLPEYADWCRDRVSTAATLHLFNNILVKTGYWKDTLPPQGSYLMEILENTESTGFFQNQYPTDVMENIIRNYRMRLDGTDLGIKNIIRQTIPSLKRTYRHYRPAL